MESDNQNCQESEPESDDGTLDSTALEANKHYAAKWTLPNLLANLTPREIFYEKHSASGEGHKSPLLLGGETFGLRCSADADKVMNNKCRRGADSGQNLLMRCGQWAQIFCPRHLYCGHLCNSINCGLSRKSRCIRPTSEQAVANSALG